MNRSRRTSRTSRYVMISVGLLMFAAMCLPAWAWEFSMSGEFEYRYRYLARTGVGDLFGSAQAAQSLGLGTTIGLAGPVGLAGAAEAVQVEALSVRGSDASMGEQRLDIYPQIRVNKAIRWRGVYSLQGHLNGNGYETSWGNPSWADPAHYAGWHFSDSRNIAGEVGMASGIWRDSWVTAQTPWGIIALGRRPIQWGLGWSTLHEKDLHTNSVAVVAPYGPLTIVLAHFLHDSGEDTDPTAAVAPFGNVGFGPSSAVDQNEVRSWNSAYAVRYTSGHVDAGTLSRVVAYNDVHGTAYPAGTSIRSDTTQSVAAVFINGTHANGSAMPLVGDLFFLMQVNYFKYNRGNFFFNAEYDFQYADARRKGGRPVSARTQAWMVELGTLIGPTKFSLAHFFRSGNDRRNGLFLPAAATGAQGTYDHWNEFLVFGGADEAIKPYQFLIGYYGTGNGSYDSCGYPTFTDFVGYAARIDHAVAANLNVFGSFMVAQRQSDTFSGIAQYSGNGPVGRGPIVGPAGGGIGPRIPVNDLGWEFDLGCNWKLLEGLTFNSLFALWQPGDWFKWAYVDHGSVNLTTVDGIDFPVTPHREIDPLIAFQGSMVVDF